MKKCLGVYSKKGNSSVLLMMIFSAMLIITSAFVYMGANFTSYSYEESVLQVAGRSILSEFHKGLKENYGIFAFKDYYSETPEKFRYYMDQNFKRKREKSSFSLIKPKVEKINIKLTDFELINPENFKKQALESLKYPAIGKKRELGKSSESGGVLKNKRLINSLPSNTAGKEAVKFTFSDIKSLSPKNASIDKLCFNGYIIKNFNTYAKNHSSMETFFQNEVEYIIYGKNSDTDNLNAFKWDFKIMRLALNSAHIYADGQKMEEIMTLAEILTPGPAAAATAIIIAEAWAIAETGNDWKLITNGKNVAFIKNAAQWAINLNAIKDKIFSIFAAKDNRTARCTLPMNEKGLNYEDYLRMVLVAQKEEKKIYRSMDLIQINLQGAIDDEFFIKDCYTGLEYSALINGKRHQNVQNY